MSIFERLLDLISKIPHPLHLFYTNEDIFVYLGIQRGIQSEIQKSISSTICSQQISAKNLKSE